MTQTQVGLHFLDGCGQGYRLVQNAKSTLAMARKRGLQGTEDGKFVKKFHFPVIRLFLKKWKKNMAFAEYLHCAVSAAPSLTSGC